LTGYHERLESGATGRHPGERQDRREPGTDLAMGITRNLESQIRAARKGRYGKRGFVCKSRGAWSDPVHPATVNSLNVRRDKVRCLFSKDQEERP
jgi:hypothetical protein